VRNRRVQYRAAVYLRLHGDWLSNTLGFPAWAQIQIPTCNAQARADRSRIPMPQRPASLDAQDMVLSDEDMIEGIFFSI
jgi:hypothetical protein